jgi:hypothetical protein
MVSHPTRRNRWLSSLFVGLIAVLLTTLIASGAPAAVLVIDDFSTVQGPLAASLGSPVGSSVSGAGILGEERDMVTTVTAGTPGTAKSEVSGGTFRHSQDTGIIANTLVQWDGTDGAATLQPGGLGSVDLTQSNTQNGLEIQSLLNDLPTDITFTIYSAGGSSSRTLTLPGGQPSGAGPRYFYYEYPSFATVSGSGANFTGVGAIEMLVSGSNDATDLTIGYVQTTAFDWGDLPDASSGGGNFPTRFVNTGPRHVIGTLALGSVIDSTEINGVPSVGANGDDNNPATNDEDGVVRTSGFNWTPAAGGSIDVTVAGGPGCFAGWIDWNSNGVFDANENIVNGQSLNTGTTTITFSTVGDPADQTLYARFRLFAPEAGGGCLSNYTTTGRAVNGEVEDYAWDFGPNAVSLSGFSASAGALSWTVSLVPASLALIAAAFVLRRRIG